MVPVRCAVPGPLYSLESNERASGCRQLRRFEGNLGSGEDGEDRGTFLFPCDANG